MSHRCGTPIAKQGGCGRALYDAVVPIDDSPAPLPTAAPGPASRDGVRAPSDAAPDAAPRGRTVRELTPEDAPVVREVMQAAFAEYTTPDFSYGTERETDASIRTELEGAGRALGIFDGDAPVAVVKMHPDAGSDLLYFWRLSVLPSYRGQGLSGHLITALAALARTEGFAGLACNVVPRHAGLTEVYRRHGMRLIGEEEFTAPDGTEMTLLRLEGRFDEDLAPSPPDRSPASSPRRALRELGAEDAELLACVIHDAFRQYDATEAPSGAMLETSETLAAEMARGMRAIAVQVDDVVVAAMKTTVSRTRALQLSRVAVAPEHRGQGHARALVEWALAEAEAQGLRAVTCTVRADEPGNIALYEHLGFAVSAHGVHVSLTGRQHQVVQMRRPVAGGPRAASAASPGSGAGTADRGAAGTATTGTADAATGTEQDARPGTELDAAQDAKLGSKQDTKQGSTEGAAPRPLRIAAVCLHTSPLAPPGAADAGGMNVVVLEQARALAARGHQVDLLTRRTDPAAPFVIGIAPGLRLFHLDAGPARPLAKSAMEQTIAPFAAALARHLDSGIAYDVLHAHHWFSGVAALDAARARGLPLVQSFHSVAAPEGAATLDHGEPPESPGRIAGERRAATQADLVVAVSESEARTVRERYDVPAARIRTVLPGVDTRVFHPAEDEHNAPGDTETDTDTDTGSLTLLHAARLQPLKAPDLAIEVLAALGPDSPARLVLAGGASEDDADQPRHLEELAQRLGVADRIELIGSVDRAELSRRMREADALLLTSWSETFGLVALEAQASGTPVIAWSGAGGVTEAVGPGGVVLGSRSPEDWAAAVRTLLADPEQRHERSRAARAFAESRTWEVSALRLEACYRHVLVEEENR